jgi:hypothetical protein
MQLPGAENFAILWREFNARLRGMPDYRETVVQDTALAS